MIFKLFFKNTVFLLFFTMVSYANCKKNISLSYSAPQNTGFYGSKTNLKDSLRTSNIITGANRYAVYLPILKDKRVGVVTNQTGIVCNGIHLVDFLFEKGIGVKKIFAPEHGFRGTADAGELIKDGNDIKTGLPIISLYGNNKKPKAEQLKDIDLIVFDVQDVGVRFYTYISTLHYVMEACAEQNIELLVLDRPNPNGDVVDGPVLETAFKSFVGMHPVPVLHGMTIGEYARMINGEQWLTNKVRCKLEVVPCSEYKRNMYYDLPVKPSPNLPNSQAVNLYASLCLFEGTNVSVGRGTNKQFQIYGSPYLKDKGFSFTPLPNVGAKEPLWNEKLCYGTDLSKIKKVKKLEIKWLINAYKENSEVMTPFFNDFFTLLIGNKTMQKQIESGTPEFLIRKSWQKELTKFKATRKKYLIY